MASHCTKRFGNHFNNFCRFLEEGLRRREIVGHDTVLMNANSCKFFLLSCQNVGPIWQSQHAILALTRYPTLLFSTPAGHLDRSRFIVLTANFLLFLWKIKIKYSVKIVIASDIVTGIPHSRGINNVNSQPWSIKGVWALLSRSKTHVVMGVYKHQGVSNKH